MITKVDHHNNHYNDPPSPTNQLNYHLDTYELNDFLKVNDNDNHVNDDDDDDVDDDDDGGDLQQAPNDDVNLNKLNLIKLNQNDLMQTDFFDSIDIDDDCSLSLNSDQLGDDMIDINNHHHTQDLDTVQDDVACISQTYQQASTNNSFNNDDCSSSSVNCWITNNVVTPSPTSSIVTNTVVSSSAPSPLITSVTSCKQDCSIQVSNNLMLDNSDQNESLQTAANSSAIGSINSTVSICSNSGTQQANKPHIATSPLFSTETDEIPRHTFCPLCDNSRSFCSSSSVTRHLRSVHKLTDLTESKGCYCLLCNEFFEDLNIYFNDLQQKHQLVIQKHSEVALTKHKFNSFDGLYHNLPIPK